jgi:hypothetical protein
MTMAYRVTIKLTKTDTKPWYFTTDVGLSTAQRMASSKEIGMDFDDFTYSLTEAIFTKDFDDKTSANRFLVQFMSLPEVQENRQEVEAYHPSGWTEEVTTTEI